MARGQNTPRGLFLGKSIKAGTVITGSTGVYVNSAQYLTANSTGLVMPSRTALPSTRSSCKVVFITNSTGKNYIGINTTGTTWRYMSVTSVAA